MNITCHLFIPIAFPSSDLATFVLDCVSLPLSFLSCLSFFFPSTILFLRISLSLPRLSRPSSFVLPFSLVLPVKRESFVLFSSGGRRVFNRISKTDLISAESVRGGISTAGGTSEWTKKKKVRKERKKTTQKRRSQSSKRTSQTRQGMKRNFEQRKIYVKRWISR